MCKLDAMLCIYGSKLTCEIFKLTISCSSFKPDASVGIAEELWCKLFFCIGPCDMPVNFFLVLSVDFVYEFF